MNETATTLEAERDAKRRQQYAERLQLKEDTRHIDMLSKPLVQIPGRFIQAFDRAWSTG